MKTEMWSGKLITGLLGKLRFLSVMRGMTSGFRGKYYDSETGLHYNWNRYYDPSTGRYLTPDPIGLDGGINLYSYSHNNPVNLIDLFGLKPGDNFKTMDEAAIDGIDYIFNSKYGSRTYEYGGYI